MEQSQDIGELAKALSKAQSGACLCGCGKPTRISNYTDKRIGAVKGQPYRFVRGHQSRSDAALYVVRDLGHTTPCWVFTGSTNEFGYGEIQRNNIRLGAHRYMFAKSGGDIPDGYFLDHLCRNTSCINPCHLEAVTPAENVRRGNNTKLTHAQAAEIRRLMTLEGWTAPRISRMFGVAESTAREIKRGHNWRGI